VTEPTLTEPARTLPSSAPVGLGAVGLSRRARRRERVGRLALLTADLLAVGVALVVVALLPLSDGRLTWWLLAFPPFYVLLAKTAGLYDRDQFVVHKTTLDEAPVLLAVAAIFALTIEGVQALQYTGGSHPLPLWVVLTGALVVMRGLARFVTVRASPQQRLLVVGDRAAATLVRRRLAIDPSLNATVVGRVALGEDSPGPRDTLLGTIGELPALARRHDIERVIVAPTREGGEDVVEAIRMANASGVRVEVLPRMLEVIGTSVEFDDLGGHVLLGLRGFGLSPSSRVLKRLFDVLVTGALLVLLAPVLAAIALAVKLSSHGPVLFRQVRVGRMGREFEMLKFRTMVEDADARKRELDDRNQAAPLFKVADDPRSTSIGGFLRRRSLDELPQLFNVLKGDMSLVGPRPLIVDEDRLFSGWQRRRHQVAPGITGPWQIQGSSRVPLSDMVILDYIYAANWSLWLDAKILVRTVAYVLSRRSPENPIAASRREAPVPAPVDGERS
jgi:exopolysaccharide biosynthesis polyprenyl glycosylphosphotransferase